jgi:hypothetical protein
MREIDTNLGKGEVVSSILTGSTMKSGGFVTAPLRNRAEQNAKLQGKTHQIHTKRSPPP